VSTTAPVPPREAAPPTADADRLKQMRQAEEMLFSGPERSGFAKALYRGEFRAPVLFPYPQLAPEVGAEADRAVVALREYADASIDADAIDRQADIPRSVIDGLANLGVMGMTAPVEVGGRGFSQQAYCRVMEILGGHCAATAVFVNAHQSIGIRALILFGTDEQKATWLPPLCRAEKLAAFALTEEQAGSDAANVQTTATPVDGGSAYVLNGTKRYITNGGIADVLTVMARTPEPKGGESKVTAFLVTPDLPGFEVVTERMEKTGIRGTATGELAFHDMRVPATNVLGPLGKGLRVALTVLDFGRVTFGASCTGASKACLAAATRHAARRRQFGRPLADLELIKQKIAFIAATTYAMEAATTETAALIDSGAEDYMLETAILKVFATEALWQSVYETLQIHGGQGYFCDEPYERWMRDARINTIGEGANEVLKAFIALVGMREVGEGFRSTLEGMKRPTGAFGALWKFGRERAARLFRPSTIPVKSPELSVAADRLGRRVAAFGALIERTIVRWGLKYDLGRKPQDIIKPQYDQERIADAAISLFAASCTLARLDSELAAGRCHPADKAAGLLYLRMANRRFDQALRDLGSNDDALKTEAADLALKRLAGYDPA